ncbi:MAG TPA: energy transducer TonB [Candidatus Angelobacter sp.]|nr:energy transducer TonB [Candidatus Angelobacter sp.]
MVHLAVLLFLCWPSSPAFVKPNLLAHGEGGKSAPEGIALYLPQDITAATQVAPKLTLPLVHQQQSKKSRVQKRHNILDQEKPDSPEIGSQLGSSADGPAWGDEVKPALPVSFSDPHIPRGDAPSGLNGDVIVEITIDAEGNVSETKLLQGVGYGIDEKVIAAARAWHFHPATRNGVAILSKQDYRFHFPS